MIVHIKISKFCMENQCSHPLTKIQDASLQAKPEVSYIILTYKFMYSILHFSARAHAIWDSIKSTAYNLVGNIMIMRYKS